MEVSKLRGNVEGHRAKLPSRSGGAWWERDHLRPGSGWGRILRLKHRSWEPAGVQAQNFLRNPQHVPLQLGYTLGYRASCSRGKG